jgi:transposase InsO family protein
MGRVTQTAAHTPYRLNAVTHPASGIAKREAILQKKGKAAKPQKLNIMEHMFSKEAPEKGRLVKGVDFDNLFDRPLQRSGFSYADRMAHTPSGLSMDTVLRMSPEARRQARRYLESLENKPPVATAETGSTTAWYTPVRVQGELLTAMLDTGSSISLIREECLQKLGLKATKCAPRIVHMANEQPHTVEEELRGLVVEIGEIRAPVRAFVFPIATDLILGNDFMRPLSTNIRMTKGDSTATFEWLGVRQQQQIFEREDCQEIVAAKGARFNKMELSYTLEREEDAGREVHPLEKILRRRVPAIFEEDLGPMSKQCPVAHEIRTEGRPVKQRAYRVDPGKEKIIRAEVSKMLDEGIIEPSDSPWASPIVLVQKKDDTTRFCVNYKKLNDQTVKDAYPLPRVEELLEQIAGHQWYTTLDLYSGYYQIPMATDSKEATAFVSKYGTYQYLVMPFGLTNAPATFQRVMDVVLAKYIREGRVVVYLDDICIFSKTREEHKRDLLEVCQTLAEWNLKIKPKKCKFGQKSLSFLGHVISEKGTQTDPEKCTAVENWGVPKNASELRSFLGLVGYYMRFVPGFAAPLAILTKLLKKNAKFHWTDVEQIAMNELKKGMTEAPILHAPDFEKPFVVVTDASAYAIGGALMQEHDGKEYPVRYWSRTLQPAERNYSVTEKEALGVVQSLRHFRVYILGRRTTIYTDHQALRQVLTETEPTGRRARWVAALQEYQLEIRYRPGNKNLLADSLSRNPALREVKALEAEEPAAADGLLLDVWKYLKQGGELTNEDAAQNRRVLRMAARMMIENGELYRRRSNGPPVRVLISQEARKRLMQEMHEGLAHLGERTTVDMVVNQAWWPNVYKDTIQHVRTCESCQAHSRPERAGPPMSIPVGQLFERFALDFVGPLPANEGENRYILVATEALTRWPIARATKYADAETVAKFLYEEIIIPFGLPQTLLTDRGSHFVNEFIRELNEILQVKHLLTTPYHPQTNGMTERYNQTLCRALARMADQAREDWDRYLPAAIFAYRVRRHTATGTSPFELMYGVPPRLPNGALMGTMPLNKKERQQRLQELRTRAQRPEAEKPSRFRKEQQVWWRREPRVGKLAPTLEGPYVVDSVGPNNSYILRTSNDEVIPTPVSGDHLRAYKERIDDSGRRAVVPADMRPDERIPTPQSPRAYDGPLRRWGVF